MQPPRVIVILGLLLLTASIAIADRVTFDYDHTVNFYKYKTFMWLQEPKTDQPFMNDRIMQSINTQLRIKGLRPVSEGADLVVGANLATEEKNTWQTYYSGSGWGWGGGWATTTVETYEVGTLTVDLFDAKSKELVWQGVATDTLSHKPVKRTKEFDKEIEKMFRRFPPGIETESHLSTAPVMKFLAPIIGA